MPSRRIAGIMGAGEGARPEALEWARELGERLAHDGWVVLTGGRNAGIMAAACEGAKRVEGSLTIGILPEAWFDSNPWVDVPIVTGMGMARNVINVLSSRVIFAVGHGGAGTLSEVALALKAERPVILLRPHPAAAQLFSGVAPTLLHIVESVDEAMIALAERFPS